MGSNLWRWSSSPPSLPSAMFLVKQKLISLRHGGWVVFTSKFSLHYIIIYVDFISVLERGTEWSIHSSAGAHTKTGYLAEWNQIVCTWLNHWNHRVVFMWTGIAVRAFAFCNLPSASLAPVIVLPALGWAVKGRLEGWSAQNMTLSLYSSCSLLPSIEGGDWSAVQRCCCRANPGKGLKMSHSDS